MALSWSGGGVRLRGGTVIHTAGFPDATGPYAGHTGRMTIEHPSANSVKYPWGTRLSVFLIVWTVLMLFLAFSASEEVAACRANDGWMCIDLSPLFLAVWLVVGLPCLIAVIILGSGPLVEPGSPWHSVGR